MTIICTVTNDLSYDQRMHRICSTLAENGHSVELVGRSLPHSVALHAQLFRQRRLACRFRGGVLFYAEYNLRLFWYLLFARYDAVCSVDLDSLPAGCAATLLRRKRRVFDAHEYFTEVPELTDRPFVRWCWSLLARLCLPFYRHAYTVGPALAELFSQQYKIPFGVVRNTPVPIPAIARRVDPSSPRVLLYQGALNEARGIEHMLEALPQLEGVELWLAGEGDRSEALRQQAAQLNILDKVRFLGYVQPANLKTLTQQAWLGINVLENKGLSYYFSLANKFFDYVQAGVPVLTMNFPEYRRCNEQFEVALLLDHLSAETFRAAVQHLLDHPEDYQRLQQNTQHARDEWNWAHDKIQLLAIWGKVGGLEG
ncbi:MAG: glycosyltransferase [Saprospiraceae bacterium]|nr:glycosyltransferase [Saprospiraceae bacterium]